MTTFAATLVIEPVPVTCYCHTCKIEFTPAQADDLYYECPNCHQFDTEVRQGRDIYVGALEMR